MSIQDILLPRRYAAAPSEALESLQRRAMKFFVLTDNGYYTSAVGER